MKQKKSNQHMLKKTLPFIIIIAVLLLGSIFITNTFTGKATGGVLNLEIEIPKDYKNVIAGETLWFTTKVLNLANEPRIDVTLTYNILDRNGINIATRAETVAIETQASFVGEIKIPKSAPEGDYILAVTLTKATGEDRTSKASFEVGNEKNIKNTVLKNLNIILAVVIAGIILLIIIASRKRIVDHLKKRKIRKRINAIIKKSEKGA